MSSKRDSKDLQSKNKGVEAVHIVTEEVKRNKAEELGQNRFLTLQWTNKQLLRMWKEKKSRSKKW